MVAVARVPTSLHPPLSIRPHMKRYLFSAIPWFDPFAFRPFHSRHRRLFMFDLWSSSQGPGKFKFRILDPLSCEHMDDLFTT